MIVDVSSLISRSRLNIYEILSMRYFTAQGVCRVIKQHSDALRFGHTLPLGRALMAQAWKMNSSGVRPAEDPPWEVTTLWEENKDKRNDTEKKKGRTSFWNRLCTRKFAIRFWSWVRGHDCTASKVVFRRCAVNQSRFCQATRFNRQFFFTMARNNVSSNLDITICLFVRLFVCLSIDLLIYQSQSLYMETL